MTNNIVYRYLGYGTTDNTGTAKLEYDADGEPLEHSYTGVGAGEIDVVASLDNPISDGSFVSETYSIFDVLLYADALTDYEIQAGTLTLNDGIFDKSTDGSINILNPDNPVRRGWSGAKTIEFDVVSRNTLGIQFYQDNDHRFNQRISNFGGTDGCHVKIVYDGTTITPYVDGVEKTSYIVTITFEDGYLIGFQNQGSFQNVIIY